MEIRHATTSDRNAVKHLITAVSQTDVLPLFSQQGQQEYQRIVLPDVDMTFDDSRYSGIIAILDDQLVGFGALRHGDYLTHLFVAKSAQGKGVGKKLLNALICSTSANRISLRSSVNAVSFYHLHGFNTTGEEADFNGIRFVPMSLQRR